MNPCECNNVNCYGAIVSVGKRFLCAFHARLYGEARDGE